MYPSPLVSVITPYRNAELFVERFVATLTSQTFHSWEAILVNDNSTDIGPSLLKQLVSHDCRFKLFDLPFDHSESLPSFARNFAIEQSASSVLAFLDIDDIWFPEKLSLQYTYHVENKLDISTTWYCRYSHNAPLIPISFVRTPSSVSYPTLFLHNPLPLLTVLADKSLFSNGFPDCKHEDYLFWLTLWRNKLQVRYGCLPSFLAAYTKHHSNQTSDKLQMPLWVMTVFAAHFRNPLLGAMLIIPWSIYRIYLLISIRIYSSSVTAQKRKSIARLIY